MIRGSLLSVIAVAAAYLVGPVTAIAEDAKEVKSVATAKDNMRTPRIGPFRMTRQGVVVRSAEELVALTSKEESTKDKEVQKQMEAELAKLLKVEAIDWKKHVVIGVIGREIESLKYDGKVLTVSFVPYNEPPARSIPATPKVLVLVERVEGEIKFVPLEKKK